MAKSVFGDNLTPQSFHSGKHRRKRFIIMACIALFWNGISWTVAVSMVRSFGGGSILPMVFISIFLLIGLVLAGSAVYLFISLFNPALEFELDHVPLRLGQSVTLTWGFTGRVDRIQRLNIYLEGREQSKYRRGTTTNTDTKTFSKLDVADTSVAREIASGRTTLDIPGGSMHSFHGGDNQIMWRLVVHGEIPGRPDVKDEIDVQILPHAIDESALGLSGRSANEEPS